MKKSVGFKTVEVFESFCCKCEKMFDNNGVEEGALLKFDFGYYSGLDGFRQNVELCSSCAEVVFLNLHKTLSRNAKEKYFYYKDYWMTPKGDDCEGVLCVGNVKEIL